MKQTAEFEVITPSKAQKLLENNKNNRSLNEANLSKITLAMKNDDFVLTGESIKVAADGTLIDGQHRLNAIIKSGKAQKMLIIYGLDNNAFKYVDTGKVRSAGDVLSIERIPYAQLMSNVIKSVVYFKRGSYSFGKISGGAKRTILSNADVSEFCEKHKNELLESIRYGTDKKNKILSKSTLSAFHYIFNEKDPVAADIFCHKLADGTGLEANDPIYILRQRLLQEIRSKSKLKTIERNALICKAWNAYRTKKKVVSLRWDSVREPFPKPL